MKGDKTQAYILNEEKGLTPRFQSLNGLIDFHFLKKHIIWRKFCETPDEMDVLLHPEKSY